MISHTDSHAVTVRCWLGQESTEGSSGLNVQNGIFTYMSGVWAGWMQHLGAGWATSSGVLFQ